MLIATFNVNSVRTRLPVLERWLNDIKPDFLFMQETKTQDDFFPKDFFSALGYESFYCGQKSYNGVAAIVKENFSEKNAGGVSSIKINFGFNDNEDNTENFNTRVMTLEYKDFIFLNTYVPQGKSIEHADFEVKKNFFARVGKIIEKNSGKKFLWLGDLNIVPEDIDVTNPGNKRDHVCVCEEIRKVFRDTKKNLVDMLRVFNKNAGVFTFFDYRVKNAAERNIGWRIDHMLATEKFASFAKKCYVDTRPRFWERPSDHVPLILELEFQ